MASRRSYGCAPRNTFLRLAFRQLRRATRCKSALSRAPTSLVISDHPLAARCGVGVVPVLAVVGLSQSHISTRTCVPCRSTPPAARTAMFVCAPARISAPCGGEPLAGPSPRVEPLAHFSPAASLESLFSNHIAADLDDRDEATVKRVTVSGRAPKMRTTRLIGAASRISIC